jgi:hypothetical protein
MRISVGILASAAVLFVSGAVGFVGTWALVLGTVLGLLGAICMVTVLEDREYAAGMSVVPARSTVVTKSTAS